MDCWQLALKPTGVMLLLFSDPNHC